MYWNRAVPCFPQRGALTLRTAPASSMPIRTSGRSGPTAQRATIDSALPASQPTPGWVSSSGAA